MGYGLAFDVEALRRGHESHDADLLASLYADNAESMTVDASNPPSSPRTLRGRESIAELWRNVMNRGMTHEIQRVVLGANSLAYQVACRYADGPRRKELPPDPNISLTKGA